MIRNVRAQSDNAQRRSLRTESSLSAICRAIPAGDEFPGGIVDSSCLSAAESNGSCRAEAIGS